MGYGQVLLYVFAVALRTGRLLVIYVLNNLEFISALLTSVFIDRHNTPPYTYVYLLSPDDRFVNCMSYIKEPDDLCQA